VFDFFIIIRNFILGSFNYTFIFEISFLLNPLDFIVFQLKFIFEHMYCFGEF
jgi:hypothetical protein